MGAGSDTLSKQKRKGRPSGREGRPFSVGNREALADQSFGGSGRLLWSDLAATQERGSCEAEQDHHRRPGHFGPARRAGAGRTVETSPEVEELVLLDTSPDVEELVLLETLPDVDVVLD